MRYEEWMNGKMRQEFNLSGQRYCYDRIEGRFRRNWGEWWRGIGRYQRSTGRMVLRRVPSRGSSRLKVMQRRLGMTNWIQVCPGQRFHL